MPVKIEILGDDAGHAIRELRDFSAPFHPRLDAGLIRKLDGLTVQELGAAPASSLAQADLADVEEKVLASAVSEAPAPAAVPERDADGLPWDERIHAGSKALNADGTWRKKRNVMDALVKAVEAELRKAEHDRVNDEAAERMQQEAAALAPSEQGAPDDSPEEQAQDAEDEKAEADAVREERVAKEPEKVLTHDDVRGALGEYVKRFGMPAAQEDGPKVIALMFGEGKSKVSDIPDDQASLAKAVAGVREMLEKNPYKRVKVS